MLRRKFLFLQWESKMEKAFLPKVKHFLIVELLLNLRRIAIITYCLCKSNERKRMRISYTEYFDIQNTLGEASGRLGFPALFRDNFLPFWNSLEKLVIRIPPDFEITIFAIGCTVFVTVLYWQSQAAQHTDLLCYCCWGLFQWSSSCS